MKPIQKVYFDNRNSQREYVESVVCYLTKTDIFTLWNLACYWFDMPEIIAVSPSGLGFINLSSGQFDEDYYNLGVDDDTIVDYLIDAMEHGELSILNDGTIKF